MEQEEFPIVKRIFKIENKGFLKDLAELNKHNQECHKAFKDFSESIGAYQYKVSEDGIRPSAFNFKYGSEMDPLNNLEQRKLWKQLRGGGFYPKKNLKAGKELIKSIQALPELKPQADLVRKYFDITIDVPMFISGNVGHCAFTGGYIHAVEPDDLLVFLVIPYKEYPENIVSDYKLGKELPFNVYAGEINQSIELDRIFPSLEGLIEVKEWEMNKDFEEEKQKRSA